MPKHGKILGKKNNLRIVYHKIKLRNVKVHIRLAMLEISYSQLILKRKPLILLIDTPVFEYR